MTLQAINRPAYLASLINLLLFTVFAIFAHPLYATNEDVLIAYTSGGGLGWPPTELSHYNHLVHPLLGVLIRWLTHAAASVNWYTCLLLAAHFTACTVIARHIFAVTGFMGGVAAYLVLFIVFECSFLLHLSFTNACILLSLAGCVSLLQYAQHGHRRWIVTGALLLVLASLFRIHAIIPIAGIAAPFFCYPVLWRRWAVVAATLVVVAGSVAALHQWQVSWYTANNPAWPKEEQYRQHIYRFYNNHQLYTPIQGEAWYIERQLIATGLTLDSAFLSTDKMDRMYAALHTRKATSHTMTTDGPNWFWINNRLYFLTLLLFLVQAFLRRQQRLWLAMSTVCTTAGIYLLAHYYKLPDHLLIGSFLTLCTFSAFMPVKTYVTTRGDRFNRLPFAIAALLAAWGLVRVYKEDKKNVAGSQTFHTAQAIMAAHPDTLFIVVGGQFPFQQFPAWHSPARYALSNMINGEMMVHNMQYTVLEKYGVHNMREVPYHSNIVFWGQPVDVLEEYYRQVGNKQVVIVQTDHSFASQPVYRIIYPSINIR